MIDPLACIGRPPQMRGKRDLPSHQPVIHDTAIVEAFVTVDAGVDRPTLVGARTWLMKSVHLGHDVMVGKDCEIAPLTSVGGYAVIGDRVKIGQGATVKPFVEIGNNARIGMGAVVLRDVPAGETWVGNPAKPLEVYATSN